MIYKKIIQLCFLCILLCNCSITTKASFRDYSGVRSALNDPRINPDSIDLAGNTSLHIACINQDITMATLLLEKNANPNIKNQNGNTPLLIVSKLDFDNDNLFMELLLKYKANPNLVDLEGRTPLHYAIKKNNKSGVEKLLKSGSDINIKDKYNLSPIELANNGAEIYQLLKKNTVEKNENSMSGFRDIVILKNGTSIPDVSATKIENLVILASKEGKISYYKSDLVQEIKKTEK